jgi:hypothetical protein
MYSYEKNLLYAETMNKVAEFMEEIILDAMINALRNIKECEKKAAKSNYPYQDDDAPF